MRRCTILPALALVVTAVLAVSAGAQAQPGAKAAGGDAPPLNPSIVGVPIVRTDKALDNAANAIDTGNGASAVGPLKASRRNLIRSYRGAKYLIANTPPPADEAGSGSKRFIRMARRFIRASQRGHGSTWIRAQASQDDVAGPVFADTATAVFSVFTSQYQAATLAAGMAPDTKGNLLNRVKTTLQTAIVLRNRLVKIVHAAAPPAEEASVRAHASQDVEVTTFDVVMPGVATLLGDELQQLNALSTDTSVPAAARTALTNVIAADNQVLTRVNTWWPPATED